MHEFGEPLSPWHGTRALTPPFPGLIVKTLISMALLVLAPAAFAATADPIAETNDTVSDSAEATNSAEANTDEPIVIDLDVPPELQAFLAEQEARRSTENAASGQSSDASPAAASASESAQVETPQQVDDTTSQPLAEAAIDDQPLEQNLLDDLPFQSCFAAAATNYDIEESLLIGIAIVESSMDPDAVSSSNALGLMQIKWPITANHLGISEQRDLFDPCINIDAGARYLRELLDDLADFAPQPRKRLALASYRLGPNGFDPNIPLPAAAQDYIEKVEAQQQNLSTPISSNQTASTAGPVLPCLVQNLRKLAAITHDPSQRNAQVGRWIEARGAGCSALALIQIRNNLPVWLGTALTAERVTQVQRLLDQAINAPRKADPSASRIRG